MMLRYTTRLAFSNSSNIWKILLYRIVCILCVLGLTTVIAWPIINTLIKENFFVNLQSSFESILFNLNLENLFVEVDRNIKNLANIITSNGYTLLFILCGIFDIIVFSFLEGYSNMAVHESVNGYMSSLTKYGYTNSYILNFGRASVLNLARLITVIPLNIAIWGGVYFITSKLYRTVGIFAIVICFMLLILLLSVKDTIFSGWIPALVIHNESLFVALKQGFVAVFKRFFKTLSNYVVLLTAMFLVNLLAITLTAGVGLFITLPLTTLLYVISNQVMYYEAMGMRFYIDSEHIISPKKLEQQDKFAKVKDII